MPESVDEEKARLLVERLRQEQRLRRTSRDVEDAEKVRLAVVSECAVEMGIRDLAGIVVMSPSLKSPFAQADGRWLEALRSHHAAIGALLASTDRLKQLGVGAVPRLQE